MDLFEEKPFKERFLLKRLFKTFLNKGLPRVLLLNITNLMLKFFLRKQPVGRLRTDGLSFFIKIFYSATLFFLVTILITKRVAIVSTIPAGRVIQAFGTNPAKRNITNEIAATVIA